MIVRFCAAHPDDIAAPGTPISRLAFETFGGAGDADREIGVPRNANLPLAIETFGGAGDADREIGVPRNANLPIGD